MAPGTTGVFLTAPPPEIDSADLNIDPEKLRVRRYTLRLYMEDGSDVTQVQRMFLQRNAARYLLPLRITTLLFEVVNLLFIYYDYRKFGTATSAPFYVALILRVGLITPLCLAIFALTYTRWYYTHPLVLLPPLTLIGACMVAYSVLGGTPGYGTIALFIAYMFSYLPLSIWPSFASNALLITAYGIALKSTQSTWVTSTPGTSTSANVAMLNILGILVAFIFVLGFIGHELEYSLKQSFVDNLRLKLQTAALMRKKSYATELLNSMLPKQIIEQLQRGHTMIADALPEVTVLFCEVDIEMAQYPAACVVTMLHIIFSEFDALVDERFVRKIETVACVWLGVSSPFMSADDAWQHAKYVASLAIAMAQVMPHCRQRITAETKIPGDEIGFRIGLHSGPVAAGIVGIKNLRYAARAGMCHCCSSVTAGARFLNCSVCSERVYILKGAARMRSARRMV